MSNAGRPKNTDNKKIIDATKPAGEFDPKDPRFDLPTFDSLTAKRQDLVVAYCSVLDKDRAYTAAGYRDCSPKQRKDKINELFAMPDVIKAIEEYLNAKLLQLDNGKAALINRLMFQGLAQMTDVMKMVQWHNAKGEPVPNRMVWVPKEPDEIEPQFLCALSLVRMDASGRYSFDTMGQVRVTNQLAKLMLWDQEELDQSQPLIFQFGAIQQQPYEKPDDDGADLGSVVEEKDELDELLH